ncbi:hypothetical protein ES332_A05G152900v1 [Gossypium tomentosum]|uniref:RING-type E3 ubiquitin transferase n=1 Tax=Gossypium tomentosum TaxID=34277 RepID=A0A5D2QEZ1_GOSTO|nr:hypothetical protein ES332_A05G152900v1 [Gossypium tomentosum]
MLPIILLIFMASLVASSLCVYQKVSKRWFGGSGSGHEVECVVCLSKVCKGEKLRSLPICHHSFHLDCIDSWLRVRPTCPLCRISVAPERNFLTASLLSLAKRLGKWVENPLFLELRTAVCESFGYI